MVFLFVPISPLWKYPCFLWHCWYLVVLSMESKGSAVNDFPSPATQKQIRKYKHKPWHVKSVSKGWGSPGTLEDAWGHLACFIQALGPFWQNCRLSPLVLWYLNYYSGQINNPSCVISQIKGFRKSLCRCVLAVCSPRTISVDAVTPLDYFIVIEDL